jgi:AhpD family alkylhydroperoxidase
MSARITLNPSRFGEVLAAMTGLAAPFENSSLEPALITLVKVRVSQMNGCGYCIDMHTKDARLEGETEQRLYLLNAWREAPMYSERERAALEWAEAVTRLENGEVPETAYRGARAVFSEEELVKLTLSVVAINGWNRFSIAFANTPGTYKAGSYKAGTLRREAHAPANA